MRVDVVTLFPELFDGFLDDELRRPRARAGGAHGTPPLSARLRARQAPQRGRHAVRRRQRDAHAGRRPRRVHGVARRRRAAAAGRARSHRVLLTPQGRPLDQSGVERLAARTRADARLRALRRVRRARADVRRRGGLARRLRDDRGRGRGDGGRRGVRPAPAGRARQRGVDARGVAQPRDDGLLEYPQYTRPAEFRGHAVPEALVSGNHAEIEQWRREQAEERTRERRPDCSRATRTPCPPPRESAEAEHAASSRHRARAPPRARRPRGPSSRAPSPTSTSTTSRGARARTACTDYFLVHPIAAQRELVARICEHWRDGVERQAHPRPEARARARAPGDDPRRRVRRARRARARSRCG